jgi:dsDNA-binding SOS-regulon protein
MAVIAVWQCDRDGSMFEDKKQAEEHDKYLELAANITSLIENEIPGISEQHSEAIGLLLAQRREQLAKACKGKPDELLEPFEGGYQPKGLLNSGIEKDNLESENKVTSIAANQ